MPDLAGATDRRDLVSIAGELSADAIRWTLSPLPPADLLTVSDGELLVAALAEAQSFRALAQQAIHVAHDLTMLLDRARESNQRAVDEGRRLREQILREDARPAT